MALIFDLSRLRGKVSRLRGKGKGRRLMGNWEGQGGEEGERLKGMAQWNKSVDLK